jgi:hypothetical protein
MTAKDCVLQHSSYNESQRDYSKRGMEYQQPSNIEDCVIPLLSVWLTTGSNTGRTNRLTGNGIRKHSYLHSRRTVFNERRTETADFSCDRGRNVAVVTRARMS